MLYMISNKTWIIFLDIRCSGFYILIRYTIIEIFFSSLKILPRADIIAWKSLAARKLKICDISAKIPMKNY